MPKPRGASIVQIRRDLSRKRETLFFSPAERALLAIIEGEPTYDGINADYDRAKRLQRNQVLRLIRSRWNGDDAA